MKIKAAFYIDGFNLYHALDDLRKPHLKWLNLWALAELLIPSVTESLVRVVYCTAVRTDDLGRMIRHRTYMKALKSAGVDCLIGHFAKETRKCSSCGSQWDAPIEKQSDVNLALSVIDDAYNNAFDHCYLVTADGDQAATAKFLKRRFPGKKLTTVSPPNRSHNFAILGMSDAKIAMTESHVARCLFPKFIPGADAILRPTAYDPP